MMTKIGKNSEQEKLRKKRLWHLNTEVYGENTTEGNNTFIEVQLYLLKIYIICYYISSLFVQIVSISFGSERKTDPMEGVLFYGKDRPNVAYTLTAEMAKEKVYYTMGSRYRFLS